MKINWNALLSMVLRVLDGFELFIVTIAAKVVPLLVPIIPAYVGYKHVVDANLMNFDPFFGFVYAAVIEAMGYAAIYKAVQFWEENKQYESSRKKLSLGKTGAEKKQQDARNKIEIDRNRAPLGIAISIYSVYIVVTIAVNVVLDAVTGVIWWKVLALFLISTLSIPAGLLMSISAIRTERKTIQYETKGHNDKPQQANTYEEKPQREQKQRPASTFAPQIVALLDAEYAKSQRVLSPKEITPKLKGLTQTHDQAKGKISEITKSWKAQKGIADTSAPPDKFTI